jgi:polyhydroxyalkanoate synthesis regulator phasin
MYSDKDQREQWIDSKFDEIENGNMSPEEEIEAVLGEGQGDVPEDEDQARTSQPSETSDYVDDLYDRIQESSECVQNASEPKPEAFPTQNEESTESAREAPENTTNDHDAPTPEEGRKMLDDLYEQILTD